MTDQILLRAATPDEIPALLALWARAAKGNSITDDEAGVAALLARDPDCLGPGTPGLPATR
ncbi:hypothetical protein BOQ63_001520 (plasmid) [Streptomyces viridifaciens]|nr:hypothetical protein BOQ63_001520 [Streptomyces viridifaciens]